MQNQNCWYDYSYSRYWRKGLIRGDTVDKKGIFDGQDLEWDWNLFHASRLLIDFAQGKPCVSKMIFKKTQVVDILLQASNLREKNDA